MSDQLPLCAPAEGGREIILTQLHSRRDDPETSKRSAAKLTRMALSKEWDLFRSILKAHGPQTCNEAAAHTINPDHWRFRFNSRVEKWHVAERIELTGEKRNGSRVWRVK